MTKKKSQPGYANAVILDSETGAILQQQPKFYNTNRNYRQRRTVNFRTTEINNGISETTPDLAYSNREIIKRFASGIPIKGFLQPTYEADGKKNADGTFNEATNTFSLEEYNRMSHEERADFHRDLISRQKEATKRLKQNAQTEIDKRRDSERAEYAKQQIELYKLEQEKLKNKGSQ